jgi:hypothetical protein
VLVISSAVTVKKLDATSRSIALWASAALIIALGGSLLYNLWIYLPRGRVQRIETGERNSEDGIAYVRSSITNRSVLDEFERELRHSTLRFASPTLGRIRGPLIISFSNESCPICLYYEVDLKGYTMRRVEPVAHEAYKIYDRSGMPSRIIVPVLNSHDLRPVVEGHWLKVKKSENAIEEAGRLQDNREQK